MTDKEIIEAVKTGRILTVAEFRSGKAEERAFTMNGQRTVMKGVTYNLETNNGVNSQPVTWTKRLEDGANLEEINKSLPTKGQFVVVELVPEPCMGPKAQRGTYRIQAVVAPYSNGAGATANDQPAKAAKA